MKAGRPWTGLLLWAAALVLGGALPGEMHDCGTDLSDEVDHRLYCRDRCRVICERVVSCGLYEAAATRPDAGMPEATSDEERCQESCEEQYQCDAPRLCLNHDRYVSEKEARRCLTDWQSLSCPVLVGAPDCGHDFGRCPRPRSCRSEVLCDPPEWE